MTEWLMYGSVEMLLKFYAENFPSDPHRPLRPRKTHLGTHATILQGRRIRIVFRVTLQSASSPIGFSSLWFISQQILEILRGDFSRACGRCDEAEKNDPLRRRQRTIPFN